MQEVLPALRLPRSGVHINILFWKILGLALPKVLTGRDVGSKGVVILVVPPEGSKGDRKALGRPEWGETHTNVTDIQYSPGKARNDKVQLFASHFAPAVSD